MNDENENPTPTAADIAGAAGGIDTGTLLVQALLNAFWQPTTLGITHEQQANPYGQGTVMTPKLMQGPSPLEHLARQVYDKYGAKLVETISEQIDVEKLAETIATQVFKELTREPPNQFGARDRLTPTAEKVRSLVEQKVAEKLSAQVKDEYNEHQREMFEALQEKRQRDAQRQASFGSGAGGKVIEGG